MKKSQRGDAVREERKRNAEARQRQRDELSPEEQLAALDKRLGVGVGAARERARLQALLDRNKND